MPISLTERQAAWTVLAESPHKAEEIRRAFPDRIAEFTANDQLSDSYRKELIDKARQDALDALDGIKRTAQAARETLEQAARELSEPSGDTSAQLLDETRQGRAWERIRPQLDKGRGPRDLIAEAEKARDRSALLALAAELPAYLETQRPHGVGLIGGVREPLDLAELRDTLDLAIGRTLGSDHGPGSAAQVRVFLSAVNPLVESQLDSAGKVARGWNTGLSEAYANKMAGDRYTAFMAKLDGDAPEGAA